MKLFLQDNIAKFKAAIIIFCVLSCIYLLALPFIFDNQQREPIVEKPLSGFSIFVDEKQDTENFNLPYVVNNKTYQFVDLYTTIPESEFDIDAIKFSLFLKNAWVYVDDELIYENVFEPSWYNGEFPGSATCVVVLPSASAGKVLHVKIERLVSSDFGIIPPIFMINAAVSSKTAQGNFSVQLFLMVSLSFISSILFLIAILYRKLKINAQALFCLAITILSISFWSLCNSKMFEIFSDNRVLTHNLEYISFYLMPLALLAFIKRNWKAPSLLLRFAVNVTLGFYATALLLRLFARIDFQRMISAFHFLVIFSAIVIIREIIIKYTTRPASFKYFCFGALMLAITCVIEMYYFYNVPEYTTIGMWFILGLGAMCIILIFTFAVSTKEQLDNQFALIIKANIGLEHSRYELLISNTTDIFMDWDINSDTAYFSKQFEDYFGAPPITDGFWINIFSQKNSEIYHFSSELSEVLAAIKRGSQNEVLQGWFIHPNGEKRFFDISLSAVLGSNQKPIRIIGIIKDATKEIQLLDEFRNHNEFMKVNAELYDNVIEADITKNVLTGKSSRSLASSLGMPDNASYSDIVEAISTQLTHEDYKEEYKKMLSRERLLSLYESNTASFVYECIERSDGVNYIWIRLTVCIYKSDITNTVRIISYVKNIDAQKKRELELVSSSRTDSLSGLLNKGATKIEITAFLSTRPDGQHAFMVLDIDNFKTINDTMGHIVGDTVVQELSKRLKVIFRENDIVGRIGGDEFVVMMKNVGNADAFSERCADIVRKLESVVKSDEHTLTVTVSIGVCIYPVCGKTYDMLYKNADIALYEAKRAGRNRFLLYSEV